MKVTVAGKERSEELCAGFPSRMAEMAAHPTAPYKVGPEQGRLPASALWLATAANEREFLDRLISISRTGVGVGAIDFYIPRKPGLAGAAMAAIRRMFWKLLKFQQDEFAFHQTAVNMQLVSIIELLREEHRRDIARLEAKQAGETRSPGEKTA